jgi:Tat protein secretion system quality control protein TatD with DNase activity
VIPIEKLLCETDAPCQNNLTLLQKPNPYAMKIGVETSENNEPFNIRSNVHSLHQYYQLDQPTFIKQIYSNALKAFKLIK